MLAMEAVSNAVSSGILEGFPIGGLSAGALLGLTVLLFLKGQIIPKSIANDYIEEAKRWRSAYEQERDARQEAFKTVNTMIEVIEVSNHLLKSLPKVKEEEGDQRHDS